MLRLAGALARVLTTIVNTIVIMTIVMTAALSTCAAARHHAVAQVKCLGLYCAIVSVPDPPSPRLRRRGPPSQHGDEPLSVEPTEAPPGARPLKGGAVVSHARLRGHSSVRASFAGRRGTRAGVPSLSCEAPPIASTDPAEREATTSHQTRGRP